MTRSVEELLNSFEKLPEAEKRELASEIIKRSLTLDLPELSDDSLLAAADQVFLQLDKEETIDECLVRIGDEESIRVVEEMTRTDPYRAEFLDGRYLVREAASNA